MQFRLFLLSICLAFQCLAQIDGVHKVGKDVSAPKIVQHREPSYSGEARRALVNAKVLVDLVVNEMGMPENVQIKRGAGFGLDEMAIIAVEAWRFNPGMKAGTAVKVLANDSIFDFVESKMPSGLEPTKSKPTMPPIKYPFKERSETLLPSKPFNKKKQFIDPEITRIKRQRSNLSHKLILQKLDEFNLVLHQVL